MVDLLSSTDQAELVANKVGCALVTDVTELVADEMGCTLVSVVTELVANKTGCTRSPSLLWSSLSPLCAPMSA